ncbi:hypothetical protein ACH5RR_020002 [Cinchona calisaya]|uniref:Polygalacturonase n=1 Tax=Cinchona calisaya TaxID=153742 RepID=A0ABD2ZI70_9GENT
MALGEIKASYVVLVLILLSFKAKCSSPFRARRVLTTDDVDTVFDVTNFGAKPDGKTDSSLEFIKAWNAACNSGKKAKLFFPQGTFLAGEVVFQGPCNTTTPIVIEIQGTILASTDLGLFTRGVWISIENVNGVLVTGEGTLDGQGGSA